MELLDGRELGRTKEQVRASEGKSWTGLLMSWTGLLNGREQAGDSMELLDGTGLLALD